jgi:hypothetical protein
VRVGARRAQRRCGLLATPRVSGTDQDRLSPSPRHQRDGAELDRLRAIIRRHDHGK